MAKRKRLSPAMMAGSEAPAFVAAAPSSPPEVQNPALAQGMSRRPPIAEVAAEVAATAAFEEVRQSLQAARNEGRLIQKLPLEAIEDSYLVRDRVELDAEGMEALVESLRLRGQQTAIEVVDLGAGRWGLISGWRRLTALKRLQAAGHGGTDVLAIVRAPRDAGESYLAMVEENEIRVGLSYYERAHIAAKAADAGAFENERAALASLFQAASRARRSKIGSFIKIVRSLDEALRFPAHISERLGLSLCAALERDADFAGSLRQALHQACPKTAEEEMKLLAAMVEGISKATKSPALPPMKPDILELSAGLRWHAPKKDRLVLEGSALEDQAFRAKLMEFLKANG